MKKPKNDVYMNNLSGNYADETEASNTRRLEGEPTVEYSRQHDNLGWKGVKRHHPTRLGDVLKEDLRSEASVDEKLPILGILAGATAAAAWKSDKKTQDEGEQCWILVPRV